MKLEHTKIKASFHQLCDVLQPKVSTIKDALEYVSIGEYTLALEFISDWCVDEEPAIELTLSEIFLIKEIGQKINRENMWIELIPLLSHCEMKDLPVCYIDKVTSYIESQEKTNSQREKWLARIDESVY